MTRKSRSRGYLRGDRGCLGRLRVVRVRTIELRILGVVLAALWIAAFVLVLLGYRPGGPIDLAVGLVALGPDRSSPAAAVALAAGRARATGHSRRSPGSALGAILLLVPSLAGLVTQLTGRGPQTLLPSVEAAYPWLLALVGTGLFAGLGLARRRLGETALRRRRRFLVGSAARRCARAARDRHRFRHAPRWSTSSRCEPARERLPLRPDRARRSTPPACTAPLDAGATAQARPADGQLDRRPADRPDAASTASATAPTLAYRGSRPRGSRWAAGHDPRPGSQAWRLGAGAAVDERHHRRGHRPRP